VPSPRHRLGRGDGQLAADARGLVLKAKADVQHQARQVQRLEVQIETSRLDARDVEQVVDEALQPVRLRADLAQLLGQARRRDDARAARRDALEVGQLQL